MSVYRIRHLFGDCWEVDGWRIRDREDIEFTQSAHHLVAPYIPEPQVWVDVSATKNDLDQYLQCLRALDERGAMRSGMARWDAFDLAKKWDIDRRRGITPGKGSVVHKSIGWTKDDLEILLVDGFRVSNEIFVDFTMGGNPYAYPEFVPEGKIWIDDRVLEGERPCVVLHEDFEDTLIRFFGLDYESAHPQASQFELAYRRRNPKLR